MTISLDKLTSFKNFVSKTKITFKKTDNLIDKIWLERPNQSNGLIYEHKSKFSGLSHNCLLYTSPSPRDVSTSRMPSSA